MIRTDKLRGIISERGLSQTNVAHLIGITPKTFYEKMAKGVFGNQERLARLNAITHPNVKKEIFHRIDGIKEKGEASFIAVEAALLLEEGYQNDFDMMWYVYVDEETRIERLKEGRGYTEEKCRDIMAKQLPEEVFRKECSTVIDNHLGISETENQIKTAVESLLSLY